MTTQRGSSQLDLIDGHGLAERATRPTMDELAEAVKSEHGKGNTDDAYEQDWLAWVEFIADAQRDGYTFERDTPNATALLLFARWLARIGRLADGDARRSSAPATVRRRVTGVVAGWKRIGHVIPRGITADARKWIKDHEDELIANRASTGRGKAPALETWQLHALVHATDPHTLAGYRDRALLLIGFTIAARRSELAYLDVDDLTEEAEGLDVHVRRSKTGQRHAAVTPGKRDTTCAVRAWRAWQSASGIVSGAALRQVDRHDKVRGRLSGESVGAIVTRAGERAGIAGLTGHSLRAGLATEARRSGQPIERIADQGGWAHNSPALHGYIRNVDRWNENVLSGLDL